MLTTQTVSYATNMRLNLLFLLSMTLPLVAKPRATCPTLVPIAKQDFASCGSVRLDEVPYLIVTNLSNRARSSNQQAP